LEQELCRASDSQRLFVAADRLLQLPKLSVDIADLDQRRNFAFGIPDFPPDHQSLPVISEGLFEISEPIVGGAEVIQHTALACTISHFAPDDQRLLVTLDGRLELTGTEQDGADVVDIDGRSVAPVLSIDPSSNRRRAPAILSRSGREARGFHDAELRQSRPHDESSHRGEPVAGASVVACEDESVPSQLFE
jgi:hypothetical protein